ncbi:hypothetical protein GCM10011611_23150 [Aliidongia dinghuensis]|uniref:Uncharacterized protein n=2 Tax=Aliidongia dinghuensis TaxID=1867774 RepID=A0A8J2YT98_9PROT|nr:hypothetical protein GCM10011611_23150 [Aliidongia dinghuensis]
METMVHCRTERARCCARTPVRLRWPAGMLGLMLGLLALLVGLGPTAAAAEQAATLPIGSDYIPMRQAMIAAGYRPYRVIPPTTSFNSVNLPAAGEEPLRVRFPEMAWCNGTGLNFCTFFLKRAGKNAIGQEDIVEIVTAGEVPDDLKITSMMAVSRQAVEDEYRAGRNLTDEEAGELAKRSAGPAAKQRRSQAATPQK